VHNKIVDMALSIGQKIAEPEQKETVSVLQDAEGLKQAAIKASNGGKKRIVGLYLPDGQRIVVDDKKVDEKAKKKKEEKEAEDRKKKGHSTEAAKKAQADVAKLERKKGNLSEVGNSYNLQREYNQRRANKLGKSEEQMEDDDAKLASKGIESNDVDKAAYKELFNFFDVDKDKTWGSIEFAQRMTDIGFPTGVEDAANLLYFAGVRDVDRITYEDFLAMMPKLKAFRKIIEKDAMKAFSEQDKGSGYITLRQLKIVINNIAGIEGMDKEWVAAILKKSDREKTNRIPFEFFIKALFGTPPLIPYVRDMRQSSLLDKVIYKLGRLCGRSKNKDMEEGVIDEEEEEEEEEEANQV